MRIEIKEEVLKALEANKAVVALESTIISHGMPYPQNYEMAQKVENIIRDEGAMPATIAIIDGVIKVGLSNEELLYLSQAKNVLKVSKRDFGYCVSKKLTGATTVSGTMIVADLAGIEVFATGGIGGVHREGETTFDISRDLEELAQLNVAVVCAGAKSILDLGLTMEYLETKGVEVIGYQTDKLPAFFTRSSAFNVTHRLNTPKEIAALLDAKWSLIDGGVVVANPIPEADSLDEKLINKIIEDALVEAKENNISGKETTPFLLAKVKDLTENKSLEANLALVYNNAKLAAQIALELERIAYDE
ncbi:MAG: pseudouridine-5'-phosphate glycosidase [Acholeplasmataceae bacterium]|jgi:pseudouridine-5'-phosphate glycosidase